MAIGTCRHSIFCELLSVRLFVTLFAFGWRCLEIDVDQFCFEIGRFVAINASGSTVCSQQGECSLVMIEAG